MDRRKILLFTLAGAVSAWAGFNAFFGGSESPSPMQAAKPAPKPQIAAMQPAAKPVQPFAPATTAVADGKGAQAAPPAAPEKVSLPTPVVINPPRQADSQPAPAAKPETVAVAPPVQDGVSPAVRTIAVAPPADAKPAAPSVPASAQAAEQPAAPPPVEPAKTVIAEVPAAKVETPAPKAEASAPKALEPAVKPAAPSPAAPVSAPVELQQPAKPVEQAAPVVPAPAPAKVAAKQPSGLSKVWDESTRDISQKERSKAEARDKDAPELGLPDDHPMVSDVLAKYKGEPVLLCVGGCEGQTVVVERPVAAAKRGVYTPSSAWATKRQGYGNAPGMPDRDVLCVAGCLGAKGAPVYKPVRKSAFLDRKSPKPGARTDATASE